MNLEMQGQSLYRLALHVKHWFGGENIMDWDNNGKQDWYDTATDMYIYDHIGNPDTGNDGKARDNHTNDSLVVVPFIIWGISILILVIGYII